MKVTRTIRMEFEPKDKPFDAYEAAMEAGSPSLAHVAMKACEECFGLDRAAACDLTMLALEAWKADYLIEKGDGE